MTVKELIEKLDKIEDKDIIVCFQFKEGWYDVRRVDIDTDVDLDENNNEIDLDFVVLRN